jgi:phosphosulfolactate synthase
LNYWRTPKILSGDITYSIHMIDYNSLQFINLPERSQKPRVRGMSSVIDNGLPLNVFTDVIESAEEHIDFIKFGWGTSVVTPNLQQKIDVLKKHNIGFWFGGTLFEICYSQRKLDSLAHWVKDTGAEYFEISDGTIELDERNKCSLINELSSEFKVLSEIGSKDSDQVMSPSTWIQHITRELDAGAWKVIAEGRESGTAGIYRSTGEVRLGLIQDMADAGINFDSIFFEAPKKSQQVWFLRNFGTHVNLANISPNDVIGLETLRLGLRADTAILSVPNHHPFRRKTDLSRQDIKD